MQEIVSVGEDKRKVEDTLVTMDPAASAPRMSAEKAKDRSFRAHYGLGDNSPGAEALYMGMINGRETTLRQQAAAAEDIKYSKNKLKMIEEVANSPRIGQNEIDLVQGLMAREPTQPDLVFENAFATRYMTAIVANNVDADSVFNKFIREDPDKLLDATDIATQVVIKTQIVRQKQEELEQKWADKSIFGKAGDFAGSMVPGLDRYQFGQAAEGMETESFLTGGLLEEIASNAAALNPREFKAWIDTTVDELAEDNVLRAQRFLAAVREYSTSDAMLDSMFDVLDIADVATLGASGVAGSAAIVAGRRAARTATEEVAGRTAQYKAQQALKDAVRASDLPITQPEHMFEAIGDIEKASQIGALRAVSNPTPPSNVVADMSQQLPELFSSTTALRNPGTLSREATQRLKAALEYTAAQARDVMENPIRGQRVTNEALAAGVREATEQLKRDFNGPSDAIITIREDVLDANPATVKTVTMDLGATNATLFPSEEMAEFYAENLYKLPNYKVFQQGEGFGLRVSAPITETSDVVRAANMQTRHQNPKGMRGVFASLLQPTRLLPDVLRGADELLPEFQNANRKAAEFGMNETLKLMDDMIQPIKVLSKNESQDFQKILEYNKNYFNPKTQQRGMFYNSVGDLEDAYMEKIGRLPTEREIEAYFKYVQFNNLDWTLRNFSLYRDLTRQGLKEFNFEYFAPDEGGVNFRRTPDFKGKEINNIPLGGEDATVLIQQAGANAPITRLKSSLTPEEIKKFQDDGYKFIQVDNPSSRPFKEALNTNEIVRFVVARNHEKKELNWKQLDYNPGGHIEYEYGHYVKQPQLFRESTGRLNYGGDTTWANFQTAAEAKKYAKAMDEARLLLKAEDTAALERFLPKNLPYTVDQFKALFGEYLDIDTPIHWVPRGSNVYDTHKLANQYKGLRNLKSSEYDISGEVGRKYVGARSGPLMTIKQTGDDTNPIFNFEPSPTLDALPTIARAMSNVAAGRTFGDYKIGAAEDFIARYGNLMKTPERDLRANPIFFLQNPDWNLNGTDAWKLQEAMTARASILNFVGQQTMLGRKIETTKQKLYDSIYNARGAAAADKAVKLTSNGLGGARDPVSLVRSIAFHTKMGLFVPTQLWQQAHGMTHILALSPVHGAQAAVAYPLTRAVLLRPTKDTIDHVSGMMSKLGWKREDFAESMEALIDSGFWRVGKETAWLDEMADPLTFDAGSKAKKAGATFLDKGTVFFREGEMIIRTSSWHAAYREWKAANPNKTFTTKAKRDVLNRADLLAANMTRASQAAAQRGIFSIPLQFMGYQMRLMDQMLGTRLTPMEKLRAFGVYSMMYGVPTALTASAGFDFYDDIRTKALENKVDMSPAYMKALMEGIPSVIGGMIWGEDYNVSQKFGPGGFNMLWEDKTTLEMLLGASGSVLGDIFAANSVTLKNTAELMKEGGSFEPIANDVLTVARNISSVNSAATLIMGLNTGRYYSKNGTYLNDMTTQQTLIKAITGLDSLETSDAYLKLDANKALAAAQKEGQKEYVKYWRLGLEAAQRGDDEAANAYRRLARAVVIAVDPPLDVQIRWNSEAFKGQEALVNSVDRRFNQMRPEQIVGAQ